MFIFCLLYLLFKCSMLFTLSCSLYVQLMVDNVVHSSLGYITIWWSRATRKIQQTHGNFRSFYLLWIVRSNSCHQCWVLLTCHLSKVFVVCTNTFLESEVALVPMANCRVWKAMWRQRTSQSSTMQRGKGSSKWTWRSNTLLDFAEEMVVQLD